MVIYIYLLEDPTTGACRYVGQSKYPAERLLQHIRRSKNKKTHRDCWIASLLLNGLTPKLSVVDSCNSVNLADLQEIFWIQKKKDEGCSLTNATAGGHRSTPWLGKRHTAETRAKMSAAHKGKTHSATSRKKMSETRKGVNNINYGKSPSKETREKLRVANSGVNHPMFGKHLPDSTRQKLSSAIKGKPHKCSICHTTGHKKTTCTAESLE